MYRHVRAIALNKTKDEDNNLILSYVFEDEKRYTLFVYPSSQRKRAYEYKEAFEKSLEKDEEANLSVMSFVHYFLLV